MPLLQGLLSSERIDVQRATCWLLAELVQKNDVCRAQLTIEVVATSLQLLRTQDDTLISRAALLVSNLARCEGLHRDEIIHGEVMFVLVHLLGNSESLDVRENCARALCNVALKSSTGQAAAAGSGAIEQLAGRVINGPFSAWYIHALHAIVHEEDMYQRMLCDVPGAISSLLEVLLDDNRRISEVVSLWGCACRHGKCTLDANLHVLPVLKRLLLSSELADNLVCESVRTIGYIMRTGDIRESAAAFECIVPLVALLNRAQCCAEAADALAAMCADHTANCAAAVCEDALEFLSYIVLTSGANSRDVECAIHALTCIVQGNKEFQTTVLHLGAIPRLFAVLSSDASSVNAKKGAEECIHALSVENAAVAEAILCCGGNQAFAAATLPADEEVSAAGLEVMGQSQHQP